MQTYSGVLDLSHVSRCRAASQRLRLSACTFHRVLKLAGAFVDLAGAEQIAVPQIAEAL